MLTQTIVNREEWFGSPANIKRANKDAKIYVGRSTTMQNLLFCVHTPCMSNVTKTFLLVSSSVSSKQLLCSVHGQGQNREQKPRTKNFVEFHNHSPLLTMLKPMQKTKSPCKTSEWLYFPKISDFWRQNTGMRSCLVIRIQGSELFRMPFKIFGPLRASSEILRYGHVVFENPDTPKIIIYHFWVRKSWQVGIQRWPAYYPASTWCVWGQCAGVVITPFQ